MPLVKTQAEGINLADTFAFTGTVSGTGSRTLIRKVTISSNTGSVEFVHGSNDVVLDSTYSRYEIDVDTCVPENAQQLRVYGSSDSGSSYYASSAYNTLIHRAYTNGSSTTQDVNYANDYVGGSYGSIPFASNKGGVDGKIVVTNLGTAHRTIFNCEFFYFDTSSFYIHIHSIGAYESNTVTINAIKLAMSSGNIASGTFKLFGVS